MNINKQPVVFKQPLYKNKYFSYGSLELPHHIKAYVDSFSSEYQSITDEKRLLDLGFVLLRGYDLKKSIKSWLKNHLEISEESIVNNIGWLLIKFNDVDEPDILEYMDSMNLSQMIDYFTPILLNCYSEDDSFQMFDDNDIANTKRSIHGIVAGHYLGEIHPNGKWHWTEYKLNKYDWRAIK